MLLEKFSLAFGPSGCEEEIRKVISEELSEYVSEWKKDALGNLIAVKGDKGPRVMLAAHMDECGLMISSFDRSGLLRFRKVGGLDDRVLVSKHVLIGPKRVPGVIGAKAIHLQLPDEKTKPIPLSGLYIDIGAASKEEAEKLVCLGDYAVFATGYGHLSDTVVKGKSFDDRAGCAVLAEILKESYDNLTVFGAFTVQEEIGLRGAGVAAYACEPDMAIVLEGTTCSDLPYSKEHDYCTNMGGGPAITIMDASVVSDRRMVAELLRLAEKHGITVQFKRSITGGSDAGRINQSRDGVPVVVISVPCRYIHSPVSMLDLNDFNATVRLVKLLLDSINEGVFKL
ncbi:MAG TPA: M42 family metallopeptidase [Bacillota bacterium]|nr:M42 family metallopeptidase [Bacillota bacterium]